MERKKIFYTEAYLAKKNFVGFLTTSFLIIVLFADISLLVGCYACATNLKWLVAGLIFCSLCLATERGLNKIFSDLIGREKK